MTRSAASRLLRPSAGLLATCALALAGNGLAVQVALTPAAASSQLPAPVGRITTAVGAQVTAAARAATGLACQAVGTLKVCSHGDDAELQPSSAAGERGSQASTSSTKVGCYGDGVSGPRVVAAYLRPEGSVDHFAQYAGKFRGWAGAIETAINASAHQTKGARHLRFATTPGSGCSLRILRLTLPASAFGTFTGTIQALQHRGLDQAGSKYLLWTDANGYCGVASTYDDDKPTSDNLNNGQLPTYARVDKSCWGYAEAHEVMHMLGGISPHAPHGTAGYHCNDGVELMCYDDGSAGSKQHKACGASQAQLFDCNHDDYFSTSPAPGSWLASHWNVAGSSFLSTSWSAAADPASPAPAPSSSPSSAPDDSAAAQSSPGPRPLVSVPPVPGSRS